MRPFFPDQANKSNQTMVSLYSLGVLLYVSAYKEPSVEKKKRLQTLAMVIPRVSDPSIYIVEALLGCLDFIQRDDWKQLLKLTKGGYFENKDTNTIENMYESTMELCYWLRWCWKKSLNDTLKDVCLEVQESKLVLGY